MGLTLCATTAVFFVMGRAPEPSAFTIQMFLVRFVFTLSLPSKARNEAKAIRLPSGDHERSNGSTIPAAVVSLVRGWLPDPFTLMTQTFGVL